MGGFSVVPRRPEAYMRAALMQEGEGFDLQSMVFLRAKLGHRDNELFPGPVNVEVLESTGIAGRVDDPRMAGAAKP